MKELSLREIKELAPDLADHERLHGGMHTCPVNSQPSGVNLSCLLSGLSFLIFSSNTKRFGNKENTIRYIYFLN